MLDTFIRLWANLYTRIGVIIVVSLVAIWLLQQTQIAWGSFIIAFTVAYVVNPFVSWFEGKRFLSRSSGVVIVLTFLLLLLITVVILLITLGLSFRGDIKISPFILWVQGLPNWAENALPSWVFSEQNSDSITRLLENWRTLAIDWAQKGATGFFKGIGGFVGILLQTGLVFVLAGYIMQSFPSITKNMLKVFPPRQQPFVAELGEKLDIAVGGYIRAKVIEALIVGAVVWITLVILQVNLALPIAVVAAILNPIPYLGPAIATVPAVLVALMLDTKNTVVSATEALATGETAIIVTEALATGDELFFKKAIITLVAMLIIQQLDGNVLGPLLLQQSVKMHPVMILVALLMGSSLFGFWGLLLAIPATAFAQLLYSDYYLTSDWYAGTYWRPQPPTGYDETNNSAYSANDTNLQGTDAYNDSPYATPTANPAASNGNGLTGTDNIPSTNGNPVLDTFTDENVANDLENNAVERINT